MAIYCDSACTRAEMPIARDLAFKKREKKRKIEINVAATGRYT